MTEWVPEVVRVGEIYPHPNKDNPDPNLRCDTLSVTNVHGCYPVLHRTGEFKPGDMAIYIPIETVVPTDHPAFAFLGTRGRIRAKRMRGVFSMGMLVAAPKDAVEGQSAIDMFAPFKLEKYEPAEERLKAACGEAMPGPEGWDFCRYTDIEALRRHKNVLAVDELVVILEKIHGQTARYCWDGKKLWVGSSREIKKRDGTVNWWHIANRLDLEEKLSKFPMTIFFGELFGKSVQNLTYGRDDKSFKIFDTVDATTGKFNDWEKTKELAAAVGLDLVPILYEGPWKGFDEHAQLAEGKSTLADHVREGFVVKPLVERYEHRCGRVIFKHIGEGYLLRDEKRAK